MPSVWWALFKKNEKYDRLLFFLPENILGKQFHMLVLGSATPLNYWSHRLHELRAQLGTLTLMPSGMHVALWHCCGKARL